MKNPTHSPSKRLSRPLAGAVLLSGIAVLLAACSSGASGGGSAGSPDALTTVGYGGAVDEASYEAIGAPFGEEFGVEVLPDSPLDYSKIKAQVDADNVSWDVVKVEPYWAIQNCGTYLEPIDTSRIENIDQLPEEAVLECGVPLDIFGFVMVYDHDVFSESAPTSWADFFDVEKYPGKRAIWNFPSGMALEAALLADGVPADELYPLDIDRALAKLDTIRDHLVFYDTGALQTEQIESGEVVMSIAWSARMVDALRNDAPFSAVWDDHFILYDTLSIVKGSQAADLAHDYLNFAVQTPQQERFAELMPYAPANLEAKPQLDEFAKLMDLNAPDVAQKAILIDQQWYADHFDELSGIWTKWSVG